MVVMDGKIRVYMVFKVRSNKYLANRGEDIVYEYGSLLFDLLNVCVRFGMVVGMVQGTRNIFPKTTRCEDDLGY